MSASNGVATFPNVSVTVANTGYTLGASSGGLQAVSTQFSVTAANATKLVYGTQPPASVTAGATLTSFTVKITDEYGNQTNDASSVTLNMDPAPGLVGTLVKQATTGVATFDSVSITNTGIKQLIASSGSLQSVTSTNVSVSAGSAASMAFVAGPAALQTAGVTLGNQSAGVGDLQVAIYDAYGNTTTNSSTVSLTLSNAGLSGTSAVSASNGVATFPNVSVTVANTGYTLGASSGGLQAVSTQFSVTAANATKLVYGTQPPASIAAGATLTSFTVKITDTYGNQTNDDSAVSLTLSPSGGLAGITTANAQAGLAIFNSVSITNAGQKQLLASSPGLADDTSSFINVLAAAATTAQTTVDASPSTVAASSDDSALITVQLRDALGNPTTNGPEPTLSETGPGVLLGNLVDVGGGAYTQYIRSDSAGVSTVRALLANVLVDDSAVVTFTAAPATQITLTGVNLTAIAAGTTRVLTATLLNSLGQVATDFSGSVTLSNQGAGQGTLTGVPATVVLANSGVATFTVTGNVAGTRNLIAQTSTLTSSNLAVTVVAGSPARVDLTGSNSALGSGEARVLTATLYDAQNNLVAGSVTVTSTGCVGVTSRLAPRNGGGSVTPCAPAATSGVPFTVMGANLGNVTVTASYPSLASASLAFDVVPGTAHSISLTTSNANLTSGSTRVVTATIKDVNDNIVTSFNSSVTLTNSGAAGSVTPLTSVTSANSGVAVFTVTGNIAGAVNLAASASGPSITGSLAPAFTVIPGSADLANATISLTPPSVVADDQTTALITVGIRDAAGNLTGTPAGATVTFTNTGPGVLGNSGVAVSGGTGIFSGNIKSPSQGESLIRAFFNGQLIDDSVTVTFTAVPTPPGPTPPGPTPPTPTVPGAPTIGTAIAGDGQATVSWTAPSSTGGAAITGYRIEQSTNGGTSWTVAVANTASTSTSQVVTGLINDTPYQFRVAAINSVGTGPNSAATNSVTPTRSVPGAPTAVTAVAGNAEAIVGWVAPTSTGGSAITGYRIEQQRGSGEWAVAIANTGSTTTNAVVTGLTNGESYRFRVAAINTSGTGANSEPSNAVTPEAPLGKSILIVGERAEVRGKPGIVITGESTGFSAGSIFKPWYRFPGQTGFTQGNANITVASDGTFRWQRQTGKKFYAYVQAGDGTRSNRVVIPAN